MRFRIWQWLAVSAALIGSVVLGGTSSAVAGVHIVRDAEQYSLAPGERATSIAFDAEGLPWFTKGTYFPGSNLGSVSATGGVLEYQLPPQPGPASLADLTAGSDGSFWFANLLPETIGHVTEEGFVTEYELPGRGRAKGLTLGPEGNVWFTNPNQGTVGVLSSDGSVRQVDVGPNSEPFGITTGSDGAVWFTEKRAAKIGRLSPMGGLSVFRLGHHVLPGEITAGPDGNLWFTEQRVKSGLRYKARVGRITTSGRVTQFALPFFGPTELIAPDPAGRLWVGSAGGFSFSSVSTSGRQLQQFCLNSLCSRPVNALAVAPDGALWYGEGTQACRGQCGGGTSGPSLQAKGKIGRISPAGLGPVQARSLSRIFAN
jgi:streptogramin lyase